MNVRELISLLEEVEDQDAKVRLATQPNYPLQFTIAGIAVPAEDMEGEEVLDEDEDVPQVVYILEGGHPDQPYATRKLWEMGRS